MITRKGNLHIAGPYDVLGLLQDASTGRYHTCIWEERPLPGHPELEVVHLKSLGHHEKGFTTREEALAHVAEIRKTQFEIADRNVWTSPEQLRIVDGTPESFRSVLTVPRWSLDS